MVRRSAAESPRSLSAGITPDLRRPALRPSTGVWSAIADLAIRCTCNLLPHDGENSLGPPAVSLDHALELGASVCCHAEPVDDYVADFVRSVLRRQTPIDLDRLISTGPPADLAGEDRPI